ncbi:MAG: YlbF family regulator [Oscillospiraceae bacterium]|nr:YlbF family regulator [Candidatus Ruminococcus equi]
MDIIKLARELGHAIQNEEFYKKLETAKKNADDDKELQDLIGEFNLKRIAINNEACKEERDEEKLSKLNEEMRSLYAEIMSNENMMNYNEAKTTLDNNVQRVLMIITKSADGEDPDTADFSSDCTHDCSTCGGCH